MFYQRPMSLMDMLRQMIYSLGYLQMVEVSAVSGVTQKIMHT